jgi:hypothetical protein
LATYSTFSLVALALGVDLETEVLVGEIKWHLPLLLMLVR